MDLNPLHYLEPMRGMAPDVVFDVVDVLLHLLQSMS